MNKSWPIARLGEVLTRSAETVAISPEADYREITVRLWGKGVVVRGIVAGAAIAGGRRFVAQTGQFILSRIDARNGAIGIVPESLDGAVVTNDFPLFNLDHHKLDVNFLGWLSKTPNFVELCQRASEGTTNRVRLQEERFFDLEIPLPPLAEQRRIVARIQKVTSKIEETSSLKRSIEVEANQILLGAFNKVTAGVECRRMKEVAPIIRRPVEVQTDGQYSELGIRSFGKGTFHKPSLSGFEVGSKRLYSIQPNDLLFNNVFAWEGAVAIAKPEDAGRVGSHRFITCVPEEGVATSKFLCFYFLTQEGLEKLGTASPGGALRNRTLGLEALSEIAVPVPAYSQQLWFDGLQAKVNALKKLQADTAAELDALLPSILDRAFNGQL